MNADPINHLKPQVDPASLTHRHLLDGPFWQKIPAYADVDEATFSSHKFQTKNTITRADKLLAAIGDLAPEGFLEDAAAGFKRAPMAVRISPYLLSLIDWDNPYTDPLRIQFIPVDSGFRPDHPKLGLDSLGEQADAPSPGLTHRYPDKVLFLVIDTCPVYCRFCTRSYAVGTNTEQVEKVQLKAKKSRWAQAFAYIAARPEVEDVVISGGDTYNLRADWITELGTTLLQIPHIRRIRFASKGLAVLPQKVLTDDAWYNALAGVAKLGRELGKDVAFHTHFNHANEITTYSMRAVARIREAGITVRNQSVLLRGVNDTPEAMGLLVKRLSWINAHPYYVYVHDLVQGGEDMRTNVQTALDLEMHVRGTTAGYNTPTFVMDAPGGGGKRPVHTYKAYDRETGISVWTAPSVKPGQAFYYFDPVDSLSPEGQARWADPAQHDVMMAEAKALAGL